MAYRLSRRLDRRKHCPSQRTTTSPRWPSQWHENRHRCHCDASTVTANAPPPSPGVSSFFLFSFFLLTFFFFIVHCPRCFQRKHRHGHHGGMRTITAAMTTQAPSHPTHHHSPRCHWCEHCHDRGVRTVTTATVTPAPSRPTHHHRHQVCLFLFWFFFTNIFFSLYTVPAASGASTIMAIMVAQELSPLSWRRKHRPSQCTTTVRCLARHPPHPAQPPT